jgi:hypothetical protein
VVISICGCNKGKRHRFVRVVKVAANGRLNLKLLRPVKMNDHLSSDVCMYCGLSFGELFS